MLLILPVLAVFMPSVLLFLQVLRVFRHSVMLILSSTRGIWAVYTAHTPKYSQYSQAVNTARTPSSFVSSEKQETKSVGVPN